MADNQKQFYLVIASLIMLVMVISIWVFYSNNKKFRKVNRTLLEQRQLIEKKNDELNSSIKIREKFYSILSHDIKNSLLGNFYMSDYIIGSNNVAKKENYIEKIHLNNKYLVDLMNNLVEWIKIHSHTIEVNKSKVNVYELINELIAVNSSFARSKNIKVQNKISDNLAINFDRRMLYSIFQNLINNAIKYSKENGDVEIGSDFTGARHIYVKDSGQGIKQEIIDKIITNDKDSFMRSKDNYSTGIGLNICLEFAELNNLRILIESKENFGTKFILEIME